MLSNTQKLLKEVTVPGKFELLANSYLRMKISERLMQTGINEKGIPVKSKFDAIINENDYFAFVHHTITEKSSLESKWDNDFNNSIEFLKNNKVEQKQIRLIFTTNKLLNFKEDLVINLQNKCKKENLEVEIFENSKISAYLDTKDGQILRKTHFGTEISELSNEYMKTVCKSSLNQYENSLFRLSQKEIQREKTQEVINAVQEREISLIFLIGNPGFGKSIILSQVMKTDAKNSFYLWINENELEVAKDEKQLIRNVISILDRNLYNESIKNFINETSNTIVLMLDDIDKSSKHLELIKKITNWASHTANHTANSTSNNKINNLNLPKIKFICTVQKRNIQIMKNYTHNFTMMIYVNSFTLKESSMYLNQVYKTLGKKHSEDEIRQHCEKLGYDPFLFGLYFEKLENNSKQLSLNELFMNLIGDFVSNKLSSLKSPFSEEYIETLLVTVKILMRASEPQLEWKQIKKGYKMEKSFNSSSKMTEIIEQSELCLLRDKKLIFRHQRIYDYFGTKLFGKIVQSDPFDPILYEPFYTNYMANAILSCQVKEETLKEIFNQISKKNILIFAESYSIIQKTRNGRQKMIFEKLLEFMVSTRKKQPFEPLVEEVLRIFLKIQSNKILLLVKGHDTELANLCLLKNLEFAGYINSKIDVESDTFLPEISEPFRNEVIGYIKIHNKEAIVEKLSKALFFEDFSLKFKILALQLVGFFGYSDFHKPIAKFWEEIEKKQENSLELPANLFTSFIWAIAKCFEVNSKTLLKKVFSFISKLLANSSKAKYNQLLGSISQNLDYIGKQTENLHFQMTLIDIYFENKSYQNIIKYIFIQSDNKDIVKILITKKEEALGSQFSFQLVNRGKIARYKRYTEKTLGFLDTLWKNHTYPVEERKIALCYWFEYYDKSDKLTNLKKYGLKDKKLHDKLVILRTKLGDFTIIDNYIELLQKKVEFLQIAYKLWGEKLKNFVNERITSKNIQTESKKSNFYSALYQLLNIIPIKDANEIIKQGWSILKSDEQFVKFAYVKGNKKILKLIASEVTTSGFLNKLIGNVKFDEILLNSNSTVFCFLEKIQNRIDELSPQKLNDLAIICETYDCGRWSQKYIKPRANEKINSHFFFSEEAVKDSWDKLILSNDFAQLQSKLKSYYRNGHSFKSIFNIFESWFETAKTYDKFKILGYLVLYSSTSDNLKFLEKIKFNNECSEQFKNSIKIVIKLRNWGTYPLS